MKVADTVTSGLHAALLFARGRRDGLRYVEADMAGARRSFWAMAVCLPAIVCLRLMDWVAFGPPQDPAHTFSLDLMGFVVAWLGFALISFHLMPMLGCESRWPRFMAAWNWYNVIKNLLLVVGGIPVLLAAPAVVVETAQIVATGWVLWIEWFAIKEALDTSTLAAALLVVIDMMLRVVLAGVTLSILQH